MVKGGLNRSLLLGVELLLCTETMKGINPGHWDLALHTQFLVSKDVNTLNQNKQVDINIHIKYYCVKHNFIDGKYYNKWAK